MFGVWYNACSDRFGLRDGLMHRSLTVAFAMQMHNACSDRFGLRDGLMHRSLTVAFAMQMQGV